MGAQRKWARIGAAVAAGVLVGAALIFGAGEGETPGSDPPSAPAIGAPRPLVLEPTRAHAARPPRRRGSARETARRFFSLVYRSYVDQPFDHAGRTALRAVASEEVAGALLGQQAARADVPISPARIVRVETERGPADTALATAELAFRDGTRQRQAVTLERRGGRWQVSAIAATGETVGE